MNITLTPTADPIVASAKTASDLRDLLDEAGIDITAPAWGGFYDAHPSEQVVLISGHRVQPHPDAGCVRVDGDVWYSSAWL